MPRKSKTGTPNQPIVIEGDCPSKKNGRILTGKSGRLLSIPSKTYKTWQTEALRQLKRYQPISVYPCALTIVLWGATKRRYDIDNRATSVLDVLQDAGILEDDDWAHVQTLTIQHGGLDKTRPRVDIWVDE